MTDQLSIEVSREPRMPLVFNSAKELETFLEQEREFWSWAYAENARNRYGQINDFGNRYTENWIVPILAQLKEIQTNPPVAIAEMRRLLHQRFSDQKRLTAQDPEAVALAALATTTPKIAAVALAIVDGSTLFLDNNFMQEVENRIGVAQGFAIAAGISPSTVEGAKNALSVFISKSTKELARSKELADIAEQNAKDLQLSIQSNAADQATQIASDYTDVQKTRQSDFEKLREDMNAVKAAFEVQMQLQGPVRYWQEKYKNHRNAKWVSAAVLGVYCGASLWWINGTFQRAAEHLPKVNSNDPWPLPLLVKEGLFALVVTTVVFWIGRVLLRIYFSNQHLATDAAERMTMVMTFLALVRKKTLKEEDKSVIIASLFRTASDGIVKDDAPDSALAVFLGSLTKGQKS